MKKRAFSLLLCLVMALSLLPATARAESRKITSVSLNVTAPTHGSLPTYTVTCGASNYQVNTVNIGGFTNGVKWYDESARRQMNSGSDTFVGGHNYTVTVWLEPTNPSESAFVYPVTATVNGNSANVQSAGEDIVVSYTFVYSYDAVAATVDAPIADKKPGDFQPAISTSGVSLYAYDWYDDYGNVMNKSYETFQAGKTYRLKVRATSAGMVFTSYTTATINGGSATVEEADGSSILFYRDFTAVADAHAVSAVALTVAAPTVGGSPSYNVTLNPSTLTVSNRQMGSNEYTANGVGWYDQNTHAYLKPTDTFQAGHTYQVSVGWIKPASGDKLATDAYGEISATATVNGANASISGSATNFIVTYTFPTLTAEAIKIFSVAIDAPKLGATPDFTAEVSGEGVNASNVSVTWSDSAAGKTLSASDKFEAGRKYTVTLSGLEPKAGYEFADDPLVTINGEAAETEGNQTKLIVSNTFAAVASAALESIAVTTPPAKTEYRTGDTFDTTGMIVTATYADKTTKTVTGYTISPNGKLSEGNKSITISYTENYITKTATQTITVKQAKTPASLAVTTAPTKTTYAAGEVFSSSGMVVTVTYSDNSTTAVTGYTVTPGGKLAESDKSVTISYTENNKTVTATQAITVSSAKPNPFSDVSASDYYYDAVQWAYYAEPQVTNGVGNHQFGPNSTVTRGQTMTFLWRAAGCPEPKTTANPFNDIKESDYWYKAILWAAEQGITNGTDATHFSPNQTCSTAHIITFLYRAMGVGANGWYQEAAAWAKNAGLLNGLNVEIAPGVDCPRRDVVLYLYRELAK